MTLGLGSTAMAFLGVPATALAFCLLYASSAYFSQGDVDRLGSMTTAVSTSCIL